jgi:hypothetical protein
MNRINKWLMKSVLMQVTFESAKILCIIGGLVVLVSGMYFFALSRLALGLGATVISGQVKHLLWSSAMVVVGVIAYQFDGGGSLWSYGPILVIAAGVLAIIAHVI